MADAKHDWGQALAIVVLAMVVILGFMGLAVDLGYMRYTKRQMQKLADAAALAAALELSSCGSTPDCSALTTAAQAAVTENGFAGSTLVTQSNSCVGSGGLTVAVNNGPLCLGSPSADPHYNNTNFVEVAVSQVVPLMFTRIFGVSSAPVMARAEAGLGNSPNCLWALGSTGIDLSVSGAVSLNLPNCSIYDNSSSSNAVDLAGSGSITAQSINVVGNVTKGGGTHISPTPNTGVVAKANPLSYLTAPSYTPCTALGTPTVYNSTTVATIGPGNYCGGITISNSANVTFTAGNYVVAHGLSIIGASQVTLGAGVYVIEGGGLSIGNSAQVTSTGGVTFFMTGTSTFPYGPVSFTGAGAINLTAPTSGSYAGILFYQDSTANGATSPTGPTGGNASNFGNGSAAVLTGALYFPTTDVDYSGAASASYTILVANAITISNSAQINSDYSSLSSGSPIKSTNGALGE